MTMIIGCDFHPSFQQIAYVDAKTGVRHSPRFGIKADYLIGHPVSPVYTRKFE
jgi:hypothetical protein